MNLLKTHLPLATIAALLVATTAGAWRAAWFASNVETRLAALEKRFDALEEDDHAAQSCPLNPVQEGVFAWNYSHSLPR